MNFTTRISWKTWLKLLFLLFYLIVVIRSSWLNDDAYITFRTVDNFVHGYGLTWNTDERVQAYTHPLWLFLLSAVYALTGEIFYTAQWLSIGISAVTAWLIAFKVVQDWKSAVLALLALTLSKAFIDYSTSGLENPLTHLILALYLWVYFSLSSTQYSVLSGKQMGWLSMLAAWGILNRMDTALIFLPMLAYVLWQNRWKKSVTAVFWGFLPLIGWEIFSIVYYGFPFPNTAYAKAFATGVPTTTLIQQGLLYLLNSLKWDPLTLTTIVAALLVIGYWLWLPTQDETRFTLHVSRFTPPTLGILLYLLYILKIGGDFMSGRFLAAPFLAAVILLVQHSASNLWLHSTQRFVVTAVLFLLFLGFIAPHPTPLNGSNYDRLADQEAWRDGDIADERMYYYPYTGLLNPNRQIHPWAAQGMEIHANGPTVLEHGNIGFLGFYAGPAVHIVDRNGLADPLLARLPARDTQNWRIGHFRRNVPEGYTDGFWTGENHIAEPGLAAYYDKLIPVIRGDLFDRQRWAEIWRLNTGQYNDLLQQ